MPADTSVPPPASTAGRAADSGASSSVPPERPTVNNSTKHGHGPFRAHGMKREERMADVGEDLGGRDAQGSTGRRTFNPVDKAYSASSQFDKDGRGKRKRHQSPTDTASRKKGQASATDSKSQPSTAPSKAKATKAKRQTVDLQFVLLPQTSAVYSEKYKRLNLADIVRLHDQGFVSKKVMLSVDAINKDICDAVSSLDSGCFQDPTVASFLSTYGSQTLQAFPPPVKSGKRTTQGETYYVRTMRDGRDKDVDVQTLKQATAFTGLHGGPKAGYDNLVLIALPPDSPDVPFKAYTPTCNETSEGEDERGDMDDDSSEEGMGEGEDQGEDADDAGDPATGHSRTSDAGDDTETFQAPQDNMFGQEYFETYTANEDYVNPDHTSNGEEQDRSTGNTRTGYVSDAHLTLWKLLLNMHAPDLGSRGAKAVDQWWANEESPSEHLHEFINERPWIEKLLDKVLGKSSVTSSQLVHLPILLLEVETGVIKPLTFLVALADKLSAFRDGPPANIDAFADTLRQQFMLGPGGLHAVSSVMTRIYSLFNLDPCKGFGGNERDALFGQLHARSQAALSLLFHLRELVPQSHWVPKPHFREFFQAYNSVKNDLSHATSVEWELSGLAEVDVTSIMASDLEEKLSGAFGHHSNHLLMNSYSIKAGEFGLDRFVLRFLVPILDDPPLSDDERYEQVLNSIQTFLSAVTRKLRNFAKTRGKSSKSSKAKETEKPKSTRIEMIFIYYAESPSTDGGKGSWRDLGEDRFEPGAKDREDAKSGKTKPPRTDPPPNQRPAPRSPPKPRPKVKTPTTPLGKLELLESRIWTLSWSTLVDEILKKFPHPSKPIASHSFDCGASIKMQHMRLSTLYHPDKNLGGSFTPEWHIIAGRICALLNGKKEAILGNPWVPEPGPAPKE
ncbi:hypothetical protein V8D89_010040 [Ganoderma adspersum]